MVILVDPALAKADVVKEPDPVPPETVIEAFPVPAFGEPKV